MGAKGVCGVMGPLHPVIVKPAWPGHGVFRGYTRVISIFIPISS